MKKLVLAAVAILCACNPNKTVLDAEFHPTDRGWGSPQPVWRDEFKGTSLDTSKWVAAEFCGGYNQEKQCYQPENLSFDGDHLTITAKEEDCFGDTLPADANTVEGNNEVGTVTCTSASTAHPFSSGRIHTRVAQPDGPHTWRYGRIEIRAKLPYGDGTWPAFWMMPHPRAYGDWPKSGEIDIMETVDLDYVNQKHDTQDFLQANIHLCDVEAYQADPKPVAGCDDFDVAPHWDYSKRHLQMKLDVVPGWDPDLVGSFHTYALEWTDLDMRFFVDNKLIGTAPHIGDPHDRVAFRQPFYLIINLAVGGDWPKPPAPSGWMQGASGGEAKLVIDWVRVYACVPDPLDGRDCVYEGIGLGEGH